MNRQTLGAVAHQLDHMERDVRWWGVIGGTSYEHPRAHSEWGPGSRRDRCAVIHRGW